MKKITFFFTLLLIANLSVAQTIGLFDLDIAASSSTLNVNNGSTITINNTLGNCLPNYDGSNCEHSDIYYDLSFYLVDGTNEYFLFEVNDGAYGYNCTSDQGWYSYSPNYNFTVPCYVPSGTYSLRVVLTLYSSVYFWNLSASSMVQITAGSSTLIYGGYPGGPLPAPYPYGDIATVNVTNSSSYVSGITFTTNNATCSDLNNGSATANPTGGSGNYSYLWSNGQTGQTATNLGAGTYTVEVTDITSGCTVSSNVFNESAEVSNNYSVSATLSTSHICGTDPGYISASASGGVAPYGYTWNTSQTTSGISVTSGGTYTAEIEDANGCTASASTDVEESSYPTLALREGDVIKTCNDEYEVCGYADQDPNGTNFTYAWSYMDPNLQQSVIVSNDPCFTPVASAGYGVFTLSVTNEYGCQTTISISVLPAKGCGGAGGGGSSGMTASVYPNPIGVGETLRIGVDSDSEAATLEIIDVKTGKIVFTSEITKDQPVEKLVSDFVTDNSPAVYFIKVYNQSGIAIERLVVK